MGEKTHSEILFERHLQAVGKLDYAKGKRPNVECIFCAIKNDNPNVISLKLYENEVYFICLNLYPYNPGHLMIIPSRHVERFEDLTKNERTEIFEATIKAQKMLRKELEPTGFNVGYNQGKYSGASIDHIHIHIVPRYKSELGFIDIIGQTKIIIQRASDILDRLAPKVTEYMEN